MSDVERKVAEKELQVALGAIERRFAQKNQHIAQLLAIVNELVTLDDKKAPAVMNHDEFTTRWKAMMVAAKHITTKEV